MLPGETDRPVVVLRTDGCPVALLMPMLRAGDPPGAYVLVNDMTTALGTTGVAELARRAVARSAARRFDPVLCADVEGRYTGSVRVERIITHLSDLA